jgi:hypothetical protein
MLARVLGPTARWRAEKKEANRDQAARGRFTLAECAAATREVEEDWGAVINR